MDNFSMYGTNAALLLDNIYIANDSCSIVADPDPLATGRVLRGGGGTSLSYPFPASVTIAGVGVRVYLPSINFTETNRGIIDIEGIQIGINNVGALLINNTLASAGPVLGAQSWFHLEAKFDLVSVPGSAKVDVRVNGVAAGTLTFVTLKTSLTYFITRSPSTTTLYKDLVIWNGLGTLNNNFMGQVTVVSMSPQSDAAVGGWTPSIVGPLTAMIDNYPPLDATQFIDAATPLPAACQFETTNLPPDIATVKAIKTFARARKIDGGDGNIQVSMVSGVSTANGANRPVTTAFAFWQDVFETDPATSAAWTVSGANASKLKLDRTV